ENEGAVFDGADRKVLEAAFGNSPYLSRLAVRERAMLSELFASGPDAIVERARADALSAAETDDMNEAMRRLRVAKRRAALAIALADIAGLWDLDNVTRELTFFADACVKGALRFMLREAAARAEMP